MPEEAPQPEVPQRNDWRFIGFGAALGSSGIFMIVQGIAHIRSGLPIPGDEFLAESTGWDTFIAGIASIAMGAWLAWRGHKRKR